MGGGMSILTHQTKPNYGASPPVDPDLDDDSEILFIPSRPAKMPGRTSLNPDEKLMRNLETSRQLSESIRDSTRPPDQDVLKLCALSFDNISQMSAIHLNKDVLDKVPLFDGTNRDEFFNWIDDVERTAHHTGMSPLRVARMRSAKNVYTTLNGIPQDHDWKATKLILQQYYSNSPTTGHAMIKLMELQQNAHEHIRDYCQKFALLNRAACGKGPKEDTNQQSKLTFLRSLFNAKIVTEVCKKGDELPRTLYEVMELACDVHKRFQFIEGVKGATTMMSLSANRQHRETMPSSPPLQIAALQNPQVPSTTPGTVICSICGGPHTSAICTTGQGTTPSAPTTNVKRPSPNANGQRKTTWQQRRPTGTITQNISTEVPLTTDMWAGIQKSVDLAVAEALQKQLDNKQRWSAWNAAKKSAPPTKPTQPKKQTTAKDTKTKGPSKPKAKIQAISTEPLEEGPDLQDLEENHECNELEELPNYEDSSVDDEPSDEN